MGRPPMLTAHQRTEALRALADGSATQADLARRFNVSQSTISRLGNKLIPAKAQPPLDSDTERAARVFMSRISGRYARSEEHTSELQSLMRISYAVICLKKK